jgi:hypothetical protein
MRVVDQIIGLLNKIHITNEDSADPLTLTNEMDIKKEILSNQEKLYECRNVKMPLQFEGEFKS